MVTVAGGSAPSPLPSALVVAGDEETRILLRGLLRLQHHRVIGEADSSARGVELAESLLPDLVVVDVHLTTGTWASLVEGIRKLTKPSRVILIAPGIRSAGDVAPGSGGPDIVLIRPFKIRDFASALGLAPPLSDGRGGVRS